MQHSPPCSQESTFARAIATALSRADEEAWAHEAMWEIRHRHAVGGSTPEDHSTYRAYWRIIALRRSATRRSHLPPEFGHALARRACLTADIQHEQARLAVEAVFMSPPGGETPAADSQPASL